VAWSFTNLGRVIEASGDFNGAKQMFREGMALDKEFGDRRALAWASLLMGQTCWALGDYEEAERHYREGERLYRESGDPRGSAWGLDLLGNLQVAQRRYEEAGKFYERAMVILRKEGLNVQNRGWHAYHQGALRFFQGDYAGADKWLRQGLAAFRSVADPLGQATCLTHLGESALERGRLREAEGCFARALELALPIRLMPHVADLLVAVAKLLKSRGDERSALVFLVAALSHPTCRRQTKDKIVLFTTKLESRFTTDEVQDAVQQAKASRLEDLAQAWLSGLHPARAREKARPRAPRRRKKR
ncbi:MAG TPA: tetratricopeptide repeat protein, partial [bacterium]|nr:tetratricopeptide repeat protein [bacterium]